MTIRTLAVLLLFACNSFLLTIQYSIVFEDSENTQQTKPSSQFSRSELECFSKGRVLYESDGKCYKLKEVGPCTGQQQWLVLDQDEVVSGNGKLRAVCKQCECCGKPFHIYWPEDGQCHKVSGGGKELCPSSGTVLQTDPFGEGECGCKKQPPHARWGIQNSIQDNGPCYPLYSRGPCDIGHVFVISDNATKCKKDPCARYNYGRTGAMFVAWESGNGSCYKLGSKGPCQGNLTYFEIDPVTRKPGCVSRVNQLVELPTRCDTDQNDNCRQEISLPSSSEYVSDLLTAAQRKRYKRRTKSSTQQNVESDG